MLQYLARMLATNLKKIWAHLRFYLCGQQLFRGFVIGKNYNNFGFSIKRAYKIEPPTSQKNISMIDFFKYKKCFFTHTHSSTEHSALKLI